MVRHLWNVLFVAGLLVWAGCGDPGAGATAKVEGTVTLDGAPVPNAQVGFNPAPGSKTGGRPAIGTADSSGKFKLSSFKPNDGAMPGNYLVTVSGEGVPQKYQVGATTDIKVTVEAGKTNPVKVELKKGE